MQSKRGPFRADYRETQAFESAEEAWFWFCFCESLGPRRGSGSGIVRPCETSDISLVVKRLVREKKLGQIHLKIMSRYGLKQMPPHVCAGDSLAACRLWREAMDALAVVLLQKGILAQGQVA